jgi:hypothetical protein
VSQASPTRILDDQYLTVRAKLIEVAAVLDRLDRAAGQASAVSGQSGVGSGQGSAGAIDDLDQEPKRAAIEQAIQILLRGTVDPGERTEAIQRLLSRHYDQDWRQSFGV